MLHSVKYILQLRNMWEKLHKMRRLSDIENETDENLPKNEDIQLPTGKVVRIRRRHLGGF